MIDLFQNLAFFASFKLKYQQIWLINNVEKSEVNLYFFFDLFTYKSIEMNKTISLLQHHSTFTFFFTFSFCWWKIIYFWIKNLPL